MWKAGDDGLWSWELLEHALGRSPSRNAGDVRDNCRHFPRLADLGLLHEGADRVPDRVPRRAEGDGAATRRPRRRRDVRGARRRARRSRHRPCSGCRRLPARRSWKRSRRTSRRSWRPASRRTPSSARCSPAASSTTRWSRCANEVEAAGDAGPRHPLRPAGRQRVHAGELYAAGG